MSSTATTIENHGQPARPSAHRRPSISLSVRARIIAGFVALVVILVAVTSGAAIQVQNHKSQLAQLDLHSREAIALQTTEAQAAIAGNTLQRYVYDGDDMWIAEIDVAANKAQASLAEAVALGASGSDQLVVIAAQLIQDAAQAQALRQAGDTAAAAATLEAMVPIFHDFQLRLDSMTSAALTHVTELRASADRSADLAFWLLVASAALGVVTALVVSFWVARSIIGPLGQLEVTARRVSAGDLSARAPDRGPRELSHLGSVLNEMMSAIEKRTEDLRQAYHHLTDARTQAATDPLTGLGNHRSFHQRLPEAAARAAANGMPLGVVMMDLDGFKGVNDSLGHLAGDQLLREVASSMIGVTGVENAYRYGGDEFAVIVPDGGQRATLATAESLRQAFLSIDHPTAGRVNASFGVASLPESASTPEELVYRADMAMYLAKSSGKDRVASWGEIDASSSGSRLDYASSGRRPEIITSLCFALEAKDPSTRAHAERCARYSADLAAELGLNEKEIADLKVAALLHDIGKIVVPDHTLQKPGPLSPDEMEIMRHHPVHGASMLSQVSAAEGAVPLIRYHHEHFNGSGYPDGVAGDAIPIGARVLAVTDAFDAMTSDRPYRTAMSVGEAVAELRRCSGTQFDEVVVEAFVRVLGRIAAPLHSREHVVPAPLV